MNWSRKIQPIIHFDFKNFFHRRLKEYDGPSSNLLTVSEFDSLSRKFGFTLTNLDKNIILLSKLQ